MPIRVSRPNGAGLGDDGVMKKAKADPTLDSKPPDARQLATRLGRSHAAFSALTQRGSGVTTEWKRYSKTAPWTLKVSRGDRTLFYATPQLGAFETTVVLGERATEAALSGRVSKSLHASIRAARPYAEGRPVRIMVRSEEDLPGVEELLAVKLDPASGGKAPRPDGPSLS
jgi:hypothetical protein